MSEVIRDMPAALYHADPCEHPSLSQSVAHTLVGRSPAHAFLEHPRLGAEPLAATPEMDFGSLVHTLVLGGGLDVAVVEADDWRGKGAREQREAARKAGKLPVLERTYIEAQKIGATIEMRLADLGVGFEGESELTILWDEPSERGPVQCRGRLDRFDIKRGIIYDIKTTRCARPADCARRLGDMGYDIQQAAYTGAVAAAFPEMAGRIDFMFLFVETSPPYCVTPARLDGIARSVGESRWMRAIEMWARCLETNDWPGYVTGPTILETPPWFSAAELAVEERDYGQQR